MDLCFVNYSCINKVFGIIEMLQMFVLLAKNFTRPTRGGNRGHPAISSQTILACGLFWRP